MMRTMTNRGQVTEVASAKMLQGNGSCARVDVLVRSCVECVSVFAYVGTVNMQDSGSEHTCALNFGSNIRIERALGVDYHRVKRRSFIFDRH
jgi:hypothetical protein